MHLGQIFFGLIMSHWCGNNISQKLPFPALIFGLIEGQKPLQEPNKFLSTPIQPYAFRVKEKGVIFKGEQDAGVATEQPSVAIKTQSRGSSSTVQSFFRSKLLAIKEKQGQQDQKQDKIITQLEKHGGVNVLCPHHAQVHQPL